MYVALYRKLRPQNFNEVVEQKAVVKTLENQIKRNMISHAYLFCGIRGTGKTSMAKIFAKAINCKDENKPCNKCESCVSINKQTNMDVIEIDAASNNGVDNIREIREEVIYAPTVSNYKVYIIDEVHMLSTGAFNALLKTLEEPPSHVVFILATTDPQKLPATILSRCQRFDFKRISQKEMVSSLQKHTKEMNVNIEESALEYICMLSEGALRDALSLLDQAMSFYYEEEITLNKIQELVGSVDKSVFFEITDALISSDSNKCLNIIEEIINNGREISQFTNELILHLRDILVCTNEFLNGTKEYKEKLKKQSEKTSKTVLINYIEKLSNLQNELKYASNKRISLETACLKICSTKEEQNMEGILLKIKELETKLKNVQKVEVIQKVETIKEEKKEEIKKPIKKALPEDIKEVIQNWKSVVKKFEVPTKSYLENAVPAYAGGVALSIVADCDTSAKMIQLKEQKIKEVLKSMYNKEYTLNIKGQQNYNKEHKKNYNQEDDEVNAKLNEILNRAKDFNIEVEESEDF